MSHTPILVSKWYHLCEKIEYERKCRFIEYLWINLQNSKSTKLTNTVFIVLINSCWILVSITLEINNNISCFTYFHDGTSSVVVILNKWGYWKRCWYNCQRVLDPQYNYARHVFIEYIFKCQRWLHPRIKLLCIIILLW